MVTAPPFPNASQWGFDQLINSENTTNFINASITVWKHAGSTSIGTESIAFTIAFGMIPVLIAIMVYIRTEKMLYTFGAMLIATIGLQVLGWLPSDMARILYILSVFGLAMGLFYTIWNKESG